VETIHKGFKSYHLKRFEFHDLFLMM